VAVFQLVLPACVASIVQVPVARRLTFSPFGPEVVQTLVVFELKLTVRPEEALAASVVEPSLKLLSAGLVNAIVWLPFAGAAPGFEGEGEGAGEGAGEGVGSGSEWALVTVHDHDGGEDFVLPLAAALWRPAASSATSVNACAPGRSRL
jgi:hypothetical protein